MKPVVTGLMMLTGMATAAEPVVGLVRHPTRVRLSGEVIRLDDGERMALAGLGYDALAPFPWLPGVFVGLGGYGAAGGDRGGLFVLGVSTGWRAPLWNKLGCEFNVFGGGGGGANAGQGDGLLVRGAALLTYDVSLGELAVGVARNDFIGGDIADTSATVGLHIEDSITVLGPPSGGPAWVEERRWTVAPLLTSYFCDDDVGRDGQPLADRIDLIGIGIERHIGGQWIVPLRLAGAYHGDATGYMEVFSGLGWRGPWRIRPEVTALVGAGGGGNVDTGGGVMWRGEAGVGLAVTDQVSVRAMGGYTAAFDGDFSAPTITLDLGWTSTEWQLAQSGTGTLAASAVTIDPWRLGVGLSYYDPTAGRSDPLKLINVLVEKPLTPWLVITGRARSALSDGAGGYSEGLLGARLEYPFLPHHTLGLGGEVGAAGGGGIPIGGGAVASWQGIYRWMWTQAWGVQVGAGRQWALDGDFATNLIDVSLIWAVSRPEIAGRSHLP